MLAFLFAMISYGISEYQSRKVVCKDVLMRKLYEVCIIIYILGYIYIDDKYIYINFLTMI